MMKRLYRSEVDKKIAGVCGGLGEYFDIDPVIVRAIFAVSLIVYGTGLLAYIIMWIIVPSDYHVRYEAKTNVREPESGNDFSEPMKTRVEKRDPKSHYVLGGILVVVGSLWVLGNVIPEMDFDFMFPVILIGLGVFLFTRGNRARGGEQQ